MEKDYDVLAAKTSLESTLKKIEKELEKPFPHLDGDMNRAYELLKFLKDNGQSVLEYEKRMKDIKYQVEIWC
ncbi:MAG: hypothetical protein KKD48_02065 [Nanoarchaeota archaeon]|nr:hypothetical protein [Nanoarchaeota archaeon]